MHCKRVIFGVFLSKDGGHMGCFVNTTKFKCVGIAFTQPLKVLCRCSCMILVCSLSVPTLPFPPFSPCEVQFSLTFTPGIYLICGCRVCGFMIDLWQSFVPFICLWLPHFSLGFPSKLGSRLGVIVVVVVYFLVS